MKRGLILLIVCLLFTSCKGVTSQIYETTQGKYNISLVKEYEEQIIDLKDENLELREQLEKLSNKDTEITTDETSTDEVPMENSSSDDIINIGDYRFRISLKGTEVLEDGIIVVMELLNKNDDESWIKVWNNIGLTELDVYSEPSVYNNEVYIVVDGNLYIINVSDGEVRTVVNNVGKSSSAPVINEEGTIFTIGQYEPFVTAIDSKGNILWQIKDESFSHALKHKLDSENLVVEVIRGTYTIGKNGTIVSFIEN